MLLATTALTSQLEMAAEPNASQVSLVSDNSSEEDSSPDTASETARPPQEKKEAKQTKQARDWRPKSTLHLRDPSSLRGWDWLAKQVLMSDSYHEMKDFERGPVPVHSTLREHAWILPRALAGPMIQQLSYYLFPQLRWHVAFAFVFYLVCYERFSMSIVRRFDRYAQVYGTLDETNIGRDRIPDKSVAQLGKGFVAYLLFRTLGDFVLHWDKNEMPINNFSIYTPVKMFLWLLALDYAFYCYHRSCHEVDFLWRIHQKHHQTKHPSPALAILADGVQECLEIAICPLIASLAVPMSFHELELTFFYTTYVEVLGHTGIRADWALPIMGPPLRLLGLDLMIEDHDLHHRYGKSGRNYGKQTRVFDVLFGTTTPREEFKNLPGHRAY